MRYLTRRYLGEYANAPEMTYERVVAVAEKQVPVKITDYSGKVSTAYEIPISCFLPTMHTDLHFAQPQNWLCTLHYVWDTVCPLLSTVYYLLLPVYCDANLAHAQVQKQTQCHSIQCIFNNRHAKSYMEFPISKY